MEKQITNYRKVILADCCEICKYIKHYSNEISVCLLAPEEIEYCDDGEGLYHVCDLFEKKRRVKTNEKDTKSNV